MAREAMAGGGPASPQEFTAGRGAQRLGLRKCPRHDLFERVVRAAGVADALLEACCRKAHRRARCVRHAQHRCDDRAVCPERNRLAGGVVARQIEKADRVETVQQREQVCSRITEAVFFAVLFERCAAFTGDVEATRPCGAAAGMARDLDGGLVEPVDLWRLAGLCAACRAHGGGHS